MGCHICESLEKIKNDPYFIMELDTGYAMLGWFQRFKGYTVFVCKQHASELHQLEYSFKMKYLEEMSLLAEAAFNVYKPDKMNYELLGNGVSHLHWHLYPRVAGDTPKKGPVWQLPNEELFDEATRPSEEVRKEMIVSIRKEIERLLTKK
ncbi:MAG TPA: HIT family protein [Mobilitalea sp.]|nr:HIT family protein [Mobilitalea sp.]